MNTTPNALLLTINGYSIKPELARYLTAKRNGHALSLRVRKDGKDVAYLETGMFVLPTAFNADLKQLRNTTENKVLTTLVARSGKLLATTQPCELKAAWAKELRLIGQESFTDTMMLFDSWATLATMYKQREELEKQLAELNLAITEKELSEDVTPLPTVTVLDANEYDKVKTLFLQSLKGRSVRDQQSFATFFDNLTAYATHTNQTLCLQSFNYQFYLSYANYCMYVLDNYNNTFGAKIKKLKQFLKFAESKGYAVNPECKDSRFKILEEEKLVTYLDEAELQMVWEFKQVQPKFSKVIDLLVFQSLTGLRVSDTMKQHHLTAVKGERFLTGVCQKNKGKFTLPLTLDPRIESILTAHGNDMKLFNEGEYNAQIKQVVKLAYEYNNLSMPTIHYSRMKLNDSIQFSKPKHELLSSHSMRRGFCTRHLNSGYFNETDVLKMLGSSDLKELQKYITIETTALNKKAKASAAKQ